MDLTKIIFLVLLGAVGIERLVELQLSRRHQRDLARLGARKQADPSYRWMIVFHASILAGAAIEVVWLHRHLVPPLAAVALLVFVLATSLRWWVIRTLGTHWNTEVMDSVSFAVISEGPFRWVRHPNYLAVFVEMIALPVIHSAWITAGAATMGNFVLLRSRLRAEERVLNTAPEYCVSMAGKPRFFPKFR